MAAKICLVTGASSGIGQATALELLAAGHTVYGAARRMEVPLRTDMLVYGVHHLPVTWEAA